MVNNNFARQRLVATQQPKGGPRKSICTVKKERVLTKHRLGHSDRLGVKAILWPSNIERL